MSARKLAPTLDCAVWNCEQDTPEFGAYARRELRALLAVARAAEEVAQVINECSVFCEQCGADNPLEGTDGSDALNRALARLRKVSGRRS